MPDMNFDTNVPGLVYDDQGIVATALGLQLRKTAGPGGNWSRDGFYYESAATFPNKVAMALTEFFGFRVLGTFPVDTAIGFQISLDGGATWRFWDGLAWAVAGPTDFNDPNDVDENIPALSALLPLASYRDLTGPQVRIRARLTPTPDGLETPVISRVVLHVEWPHDYQDALKASVFNHLTNNLQVVVEHLSPDTGGPQTLVLIPGETLGLGTILSAEVYNDTTDPGRTTDLFASLNPLGQGTDDRPLGTEIVLAGPTTGDLFVRYAFTPRVYVTQVDEDQQRSDTPSVVVEFLTERELRESRTGNKFYDYALSRGEARERIEPLPTQDTVLFVVQAEGEAVAQAMIAGLSRLLQYEKDVPNVATADGVTVIDYSPVTQADVRRTGLHVKNISASLVGMQWSDAYADVPLATEIDVRLGANALAFEGLVLNVFTI